jgi:hypothetical protein
MEIEVKSVDEMIEELIKSFDEKDSYYPSLDEKLGYTKRVQLLCLPDELVKQKLV